MLPSTQTRHRRFQSTTLISHFLTRVECIVRETQRFVNEGHPSSAEIEDAESRLEIIIACPSSPFAWDHLY